MDDERALRSKAFLFDVLRRAGTPEATIEALDAVLDDPVDLDRDGTLLARYGITRAQLEDELGGSP